MKPTRRAFLAMLAAVPFAARLPTLAKRLPLNTCVTPTEAIAYREFIPGLQRVGPMTMTLSNFQPELLDVWAKGESVPMRVDLPDGTSMELNGFVKSVVTSAPLDGIETVEVVVQPTGELKMNNRHGNLGGATIISINGQESELQEILLPSIHRDMIDVTPGGALLVHGQSLEDYEPGDDWDEDYV